MLVIDARATATDILYVQHRSVTNSQSMRTSRTSSSGIIPRQNILTRQNPATSVQSLFYVFYYVIMSGVSQIASIFGLLNVVTRPLGGYMGDLAYRWYGVRGKKYLVLGLGVLQGAMSLAWGLYLDRSDASCKSYYPPVHTKHVSDSSHAQLLWSSSSWLLWQRSTKWRTGRTSRSCPTAIQGLTAS